MNKIDIIEHINSYLPNIKDEIQDKSNIIRFLQINEDFYTKNNLLGHITCSAWIINYDKTKVLLTHHVKLNKWIQLGGHIENTDQSLLDSSLREAIEESGLSSIKLFDDTIFDLVVHFVPSNKNEKSHYHYNVTYIFTADSNEKLIISDESNDLKWFTIDEFRQLIKEDSMIRMLDKSFNN